MCLGISEMGIDLPPAEDFHFRNAEKNQNLIALVRALLAVWVEKFQHEVLPYPNDIDDLVFLGIRRVPCEPFRHPSFHISGGYVVGVVRAIRIVGCVMTRHILPLGSVRHGVSYLFVGEVGHPIGREGRI